MQLRNDPMIQGIPVGDIECLLGQFADDMDIYQVYDELSVNTTIESLERFRLSSGFTQL